MRRIVVDIEERAEVESDTAIFECVVVVKLGIIALSEDIEVHRSRAVDGNRSIIAF